MRKLLQRLGEDSLRPLIPTEDTALLDYLLREERRRDRKKVKDGGDNLLDSDDDADDAAEDDNDEDNDRDNMDIAHATSAGRYANVRDDHRITARPKAVRLGDAIDNRLPSSLTDLLEDQDSSRNALPSFPERESCKGTHSPKAVIGRRGA